MNDNSMMACMFGGFMLVMLGLVYMGGKNDLAKEETKRLEIQWRSDSLKAVTLHHLK